MAIDFHPLFLSLPSKYCYLFVVTGPGGVSPGPELLGGDELQLHDIIRKYIWSEILSAIDDVNHSIQTGLKKIAKHITLPGI